MFQKKEEVSNEFVVETEVVQNNENEGDLSVNIQNQYSSDYQNYCGYIYSSVFCAGTFDCSSYVWNLSDGLYHSDFIL